MKKLVTVLLGVLLAVAPAMAQTILTETNDSSAAFRIYNGFAANIVLTVATNGTEADLALVVVGDNTNTIDNDAAQTIADLAADIVACTNADGEAKLEVDINCALPTESSGALLNGAYTNAPGSWIEIPWDSSVAKHYDVYVPNSTFKAGYGGCKLSKVVGSIGGSGTATLNVYVDGILVYTALGSGGDAVVAYQTNDAVILLPVQTRILETNTIMATTNFVDQWTYTYVTNKTVVPYTVQGTGTVYFVNDLGDLRVGPSQSVIVRLQRATSVDTVGSVSLFTK